MKTSREEARPRMCMLLLFLSKGGRGGGGGGGRKGYRRSLAWTPDDAKSDSSIGRDMYAFVCVETTDNLYDYDE